MSPDEIKHFLIVYDPDTGVVDVQPFDTDYDAAQIAYAQIEQTNGVDGRLDIVLLGADSLETIKQTHSSYFRGKTEEIEELLTA